MKNLKLNKETIRNLQDAELGGVAGGGTGGMVATIANTNAFVCLSQPCTALTDTCADTCGGCIEYTDPVFVFTHDGCPGG